MRTPGGEAFLGGVFHLEIWRDERFPGDFSISISKFLMSDVLLCMDEDSRAIGELMPVTISIGLSGYDA